jgi:hypothetical protein
MNTVRFNARKEVSLGTRLGGRRWELIYRHSLNEICNTLLVENIELQYYAPQNGNDVGAGSLCLTVPH